MMPEPFCSLKLEGLMNTGNKEKLHRLDSSNPYFKGILLEKGFNLSDFNVTEANGQNNQPELFIKNADTFCNYSNIKKIS